VKHCTSRFRGNVVDVASKKNNNKPEPATEQKTAKDLVGQAKELRVASHWYETYLSNKNCRRAPAGR
jgi:hypothetical protein